LQTGFNSLKHLCGRHVYVFVHYIKEGLGFQRRRSESILAKPDKNLYNM